MYDYVIVGGGLCGCVLASRLSQKHSVILIEAGGLPDNHPLIGPPLACFQANQTDLDWNYTTVPQEHLDGKECYAAGGKVLSGGTAINRGTWTIGSLADYDEWARLVKDNSFSFVNMQKYFDRTRERIHVENVSKTRSYPLRSPTRDMLDQGGILYNPKSNSGEILGYQKYEENWKNSWRQLASTCYDLSRVNVMHSTTVSRIIIDEDSKTACGVETANGSIVKAKAEVILCAGVYRTPQILMLSSIGPKEELDRHGISVQVESPFVGTNLHDHLCAFLWWHVCNPEEVSTAGTKSFSANKSYSAGLPADWIMWQQCPFNELKEALKEDGYDVDADLGALLHPKRAHAETIFFYSAPGSLPATLQLPTDGSILGQSILLASPTSRGTIKLKSTDPNDNPVIDTNYYSTNADKKILQSAMRQMYRLIRQSSFGQDFVSKEWLPSELAHCSSDSEEHLDARIKRIGGSLYHAGGTASMGKVASSDFCFKGVSKLRVVDASVMPIPLAAHSQACLYAMAEKAADVILHSISY